MGFGDWFLPGSAEIVGEVAGQPELGVSADDEPGPAVALVGGADAGPGPPEGLFEEPEGVFQVEPAQECSPQPVDLGVGELGAGGVQPQRFGVALAGQVLHRKSDDAAIDGGQWPVVIGPGASVGQPGMQVVPAAGFGVAVASGVGMGQRVGLGLGGRIGKCELPAVPGRAAERASEQRRSAMTGEQLDRWAPLSIPQLTHILAAARFPWWVAGGQALDLFLGTTTRHHEDLDVEIFRRDQHQIQGLLASLGWDLHLAASGHLRPWNQGESLTAGATSVWCRPAPEEPWCLQLLLAESDNHHWVFRRNPAIVQPVEAIGRRTAEGVPYLTPMIQLLFKAKNPRPKDIADFHAVLAALPGADRTWLTSALTFTHPGHPWLARLREGSKP